MSKCKCCKRIVSDAVASTKGNCIDICTNPQCGDPKYLTVFAPVVYDEIGINLCRSISVTDIITANPTATYAKVEVIDLTFTTPTTTDTVSPITNRPNCYEVTLTNLSLNLAVSVYDCCHRLLSTTAINGVVYLPSATTDPGYDEDTNPTDVTLEIFAPYGVSYTGGVLTTPYINFVGFSSTNNQVAQGLNLIAIPKVLDFDTADQTITLGITLVLKSVYYACYQLLHNGKAPVSKGNTSSSEDSICMDFVCGSLLDRNIKPLEFCNPFDEKNNCYSYDATDCLTTQGDSNTCCTCTNSNTSENTI